MFQSIALWWCTTAAKSKPFPVDNWNVYLNLFYYYSLVPKFSLPNLPPRQMFSYKVPIGCINWPLQISESNELTTVTSKLFLLKCLYISISVLSQMQFSDWLYYVLSILSHIVSSRALWVVIKWPLLCLFEVSVKRILIKFWATGRFEIAHAKTIRFSISVRDSLLWLCPGKVSRHRNLELIMQLFTNYYKILVSNGGK